MCTQKDPRAPRANVKAMMSRWWCPFRALGVSPAQATCLCRRHHASIGCSFVKDYFRLDLGSRLRHGDFKPPHPNAKLDSGFPTAIRPVLFLKLPQIKIAPSTNQPPKCLQSLLNEKQQKTLPAGMKGAQTSQLAQCFLKSGTYTTGDFQGHVLHFF